MEGTHRIPGEFIKTPYWNLSLYKHSVSTYNYKQEETFPSLLCNFSDREMKMEFDFFFQ